MKNTVFEDRLLTLTGIHNFRDYGGYAAEGGRLRTGMLYRSGQHFNATPEDLERIAGLGLQAVVDLRGDNERAESPCRRHDGFVAKVVFAADPKPDMAPNLESGPHAQTVEEAAAAMCAAYGEMPFMPRLVQGMRLYFETLATGSAPVLVHCMAGKDRTGISVAVFHAMLGVHHDDIVADYMLTNKANSFEERAAVGGAALRFYFGDKLSPEAIELLCSTDPRFINAAFDAMIERTGSVDAYLDNVIGVTKAQREEIASHFII